MATWLIRTGLFIGISIALILLDAKSNAKRYHSFAGPFRIIIKRVENCPPEMQPKVKTECYVRETRESILVKEPSYTGNASFPFWINNSMFAAGNLASWSPVSGWRDNAAVFKLPALCTVIETFTRTLWRPLQMNIYVEFVRCPFFPFVNYTLNWQDLPIKHFFYNRWRADLRMLYKNGETAACMRGFGDTVPI